MPESPRFFKNHYSTNTTHTDASRGRNGADVSWFDKARWIVALPWPKLGNVLSPSYSFPILATTHHNSSRWDLYCKIGMHRDGKNRKFRNPYDVSLRSYGISTNPLRFMTVLLRFYFGSITVGQWYCTLGELGWIWMSSGWFVMTDDTPINPELPRMTTNTTTMPLGTILILLR